MNAEREASAAAALPGLVLRRAEVQQALDGVAQEREPRLRKEAALRLGLGFPEIRAIGFLLEIKQEDALGVSNFLALRVQEGTDRTFVQGLLDQLLADSDLLLTLRDVMPGSFPLPAESPLQPLKARLRLLADVLEPRWRWLTELGYVEQARPLRDLIDDCRRFAFRVYVIGEWSSGKSTLINALLGQELLPTGFIPVTPAPTRIRYGERPRLFLKRRDEASESEHPVEVLRDLCLPGVGQETAAENARLLNLDYLRVEVPAPLCENGIELVDTPGLNDAGQQAQLVAELLPSADAVLLVLRANQPLTAVELDVLRQAMLQPEGMRRWLDAGFVAFTFTDVVLRDRRSREAIEPVKRRVEALLRDLHPPSGFAPDRQYWIDAQGALLAKLEPPGAEDACLREFRQLERSLQAFLAQGRGPLMEGGRKEEALVRLRWGVRLLEAEQRSILSGQRLSAEQCKDLEWRILEIDERGRGLAIDMGEKAKRFAHERGLLLAAHASQLETALLSHMQTVSYQGKVAMGPRKAAEHFAAAGHGWLTERINDWSRENLHPAMQHFLRPFVEKFELLRKETGAVGSVLLLPEAVLGKTPLSGAIVGALEESVLGSTLSSVLGGVVGLSVGVALSFGLLLPAAIPLGLVVGAVLGFLGFTSIGEEGRQDKLRLAVAQELLKQLKSAGPRERFVQAVDGYFVKIAAAMLAVTTQSVRELNEQLSLQRQVAALEEEKRTQRLTQIGNAITTFNQALTLFDPAGLQAESSAS